MAIARRQGAGSRASKKSKPAAKARKKSSSRARAKAAPAKGKAKPRPRVTARPASKKAKPVAASKSKPPVKRVIGRPAVKGPTKPAVAAKGRTPLKGVPAKRVIGRPAVKGPVKPVAPPVKTGPRRLVPATAAAKAAAKIVKTPSGKQKLVSRPEPEVRPLGVLPPEAMAKPRFAAPRPAPVKRTPAPAPRAVTPSRPAPAKKGDDRLTPGDYKYFEQRLLAERAKIMREMGHLESTVLKVNPRDAAGELSGYSFHMADAGTDSMEREKAFDIASKEGRLLMEIDDALRRLYNGAFGICEISGKPILRARLEALPWARLSIEEQEKLEKEQRAGRLPAKEE